MDTGDLTEMAYEVLTRADDVNKVLDTPYSQRGKAAF